MKENQNSWANWKDERWFILGSIFFTGCAATMTVYQNFVIPPKDEQINQFKETKSELIQQNLELRNRANDLEKQLFTLKKEVLAQASSDKKYSNFLEKSNLVLKPTFFEEGTKLSILEGQILLKVELIHASNKTVILRFFDSKNKDTQLISKFRDRNIVVINGKRYMVDVFDFEGSEFHLDDKVQISIYAASEGAE